MAELKVNSLRLSFERGSREPTDLEIFQFMELKMSLKVENLLSMYKDKRQHSVIIKFANEKDFNATLKKLPGTMDFEYNKYLSTKVQLSSASAVISYVRLFGLPPEISDREIYEVISQYGKIQSQVREMYSEDTGFPIWTSVRGIYIELKKNAEIPALVQIRGIQTRVFYEGLINKCFLCNSSEHLKAECPKRKSVNNRLGASQGASYSGALTGTWTKKIDLAPAPAVPAAPGIVSDLIVLTSSFPETPKENRRLTALETKPDIVPSTSGTSASLANLPHSIPNAKGESSVPSNTNDQKRKRENEWQIVQPKNQRQQQVNSGGKAEQEKCSEEVRVRHRRSIKRATRSKSSSKIQKRRSRSRLGLRVVIRDDKSVVV